MVDIAFTKWKHQVNLIVQFHSLLELDDLPDENYYDNYAYGISAKTMASIVLSNNGLG